MPSQGLTSRSDGFGPVWGVKPVLGYYVLTASLAGRMQGEVGLSEGQFQAVQQVAREETNRLYSLERDSLPVIENPNLSLWQKRLAILALGYNPRVDEIVRDSQKSLEVALDAGTYKRLINWIESRWVVERYLHGSPGNAASSPRTYKIYATRYDSKGAYYVALPDQCLKFTNGGLHICEDKGYRVGDVYSVFLSYKKSTSATVGEAGPWNVEDNYWSTLNDPQPRRMFADLSLGMPEAQAAYFNGYNGGKDQYGRTVTGPYGIDLARQVSIDIGLEPGKNDWVTVSFMWTEGWGGAGAPSTAKPGTPGTPAPTQLSIVPVIVSTPNPDGSVIHEVKAGQTLWAIAVTYQTTIREILTLNNLPEGAVIHPGDKLIVRPAGAMLTTSPTVTNTVNTGKSTPVADTLTPLPTNDNMLHATSLSDLVPTIDKAIETPLPQTPAGKVHSNWNPVLIVAITLVALGGLLLLLGRFLERGG